MADHSKTTPNPLGTPLAQAFRPSVASSVSQYLRAVSLAESLFFKPRVFDPPKLVHLPAASLLSQEQLQSITKLIKVKLPAAQLSQTLQPSASVAVKSLKESFSFQQALLAQSKQVTDAFSQLATSATFAPFALSPSVKAWASTFADAVEAKPEAENRFIETTTALVEDESFRDALRAVSQADAASIGVLAGVSADVVESTLASADDKEGAAPGVAGEVESIARLLMSNKACVIACCFILAMVSTEAFKAFMIVAIMCQLQGGDLSSLLKPTGSDEGKSAGELV